MTKASATADTVTPRQRAFAEAYVRCGNGSQAAREAGYSAKRANQQALLLTNNPAVKAYIAQLTAAAVEHAKVTIDEVHDELKLIAFADLADFVEWGFDPDNPTAPQVRLKPSDTLDAARRRAIVEVSQTKFGVRIKLADKLGALDRLGKHLGMFSEVGGDDDDPPPPVSVTINVVDASVPRADP